MYVIPAKAGIQDLPRDLAPAFAGATVALTVTFAQSGTLYGTVG